MWSLQWILGCIALVIILSCHLFGTQRVFAPILLSIITITVLIELTAYLLIRQSVTLMESLLLADSKHKKVLDKMYHASHYTEWKNAALQLDKITKREAWKEMKESKSYDWHLIESLCYDLKEARKRNNVKGIMELLHTALQSNVGGIFSEMLYSKTFVGTKNIVQEFVEEVQNSIQFFMGATLNTSQCLKALRIAEAWTLLHKSYSLTEMKRSESDTDLAFRRKSSLDADAEALSIVLGDVAGLSEEQVELVKAKAIWEVKLKLLQIFKLSIGEPALCLSGGAGLACYHLGVVRALLEENLLPRIVSGTSAGACFAGIIGTHTEDELRKVWTVEYLAPLFTPFEEGFTVIAKRFLKNGHMFDADTWLVKIVALLGGKDLTFLEAYNRTGRILNITSASSRKFGAPMVLNYISAPNVLISSAILASTAIPFLIKPVRLRERVRGEIVERSDGSGRWRDGSFELDIPMQPLSQLFRAKFFIVSQTNPHIIPFFFYQRGESGRPSPWRQRTGAWRGGFLLSALEYWLKEEMKKNWRVMQRMDLMPRFFGQDWSNLFLQEFDGDVTIIPRPHIPDYLGILSDPDAKTLQSFFTRGSRYCWRKLSMISNRIRIDQTLDNCIESCKMQISKLQALDHN